MTGAFTLKEHRGWEYWAGIGLGVALMLSPWLAGDVVATTVTLNALAIGLLLVILAIMEFFDQQRWEEALEFACGLWMMALPFIFGYAGSGQLRMWHFAIGALIAILAAVEFQRPVNRIDSLH